MPWAKNFDIDLTLEKAMRLFWVRGYEATSMQQLVRAMGINRASIYGTYGDKHALFIAALQRYDATRRAPLIARCERNPSACGAIRELFAHWIARVARERDHSGCFLVNTALELAPHDDGIARVVATTQRQNEAFFRRTVRRGRACGEMRASIRPEKSAQALLGALAGLLVLARCRPEPGLLQGIADGALALVARA